MARPQRHPKSDVYRARVVVPKALQPILGKTELLRTLGTKDPAEARALFPPVYAELLRMIAAARAELGGEVRRVPPHEGKRQPNPALW